MTKNIKQKLNFQVPIMEVKASDDEVKDFIIKGTAINATTTSNNHKFLKEELEAAAKTLTGVPLLKDHNNEIDSIMGKVKEGKYNTNKVEFTAIVIDKNAQELIKDGRLNSVSVGADVESFEMDENDETFVPRGITFRELSFVAVGADEDATFGIALNEAFKLNKEEINMSDKTTPEMVTKEIMDAAIGKAVTEALAKDAEARKVAEEAEVKVAKEAKIVEEAKVAEAKIATEAKVEEAKKAEEKRLAEELAENDSTPYKIEQTSGSLSGGAFSVMRG